MADINLTHPIPKPEPGWQAWVDQWGPKVNENIETLRVGHNDHDGRIEDLEAVDLDTDVAANVANGSSATGAAVIDQIAPFGPTVWDGAERLATWLDLGAGSLRVASAGDSTMNDSTEWLRLWFTHRLPSRYPTTRIESTTWNGTAYPTPTVIQPGESTSVVVISDNFNRVAADLVGSTTSGGQTWAGTAGRWSADGTHATKDGAGALSFDLGGKSATLTAEVEVITTGTGTTQRIEFCLGAATATFGGNRIYGYISINTVGNVSAGIFKFIGGTSTAVGTASFATGLVNNSSTPQTVAATMSVTEDGVCTLVVTPTGGSPVVVTGALDSGDYDTLGTHSGLGGTSATPGFRVDSISMSVPGDGKVIRLQNGASAGSKLDYQHARLSEMYPAAQPIDVMVIGSGHNYGTDNAATYISAVDDFLSDFLTLHPDALIIISSQNPQVAPRSSAQIAAHRDRTHALRQYARDHGYTYVPAYETFARLPDGGASLIPDGIHPSTPTWGQPLGNEGSVLWLNTWDRLVQARTLA